MNKENPMAAALARHQAELNEMTPEQRVMHVVASAINLSQSFAQLQTKLDTALEQGVPVTPDAVLGVPLQLVMNAAAVIDQMTHILEEHKLFDRKAAEKYLDDKRNEEAGEEDDSDKPEGYCENCKRVHSEDEYEQTMGGGMPAGLRGVAGMIIRGMMAEMAAREQAKEETAETAEAAPPGTPLH